MKIKYECSNCGQIFKTEWECWLHENNHRVNQKLNKNPSAMVCPTCKGIGYYTSNGYNCYYCSTCKGKQIVKMKIVSKVTNHKPIN